MKITEHCYKISCKCFVIIFVCEKNVFVLGVYNKE